MRSSLRSISIHLTNPCSRVLSESLGLRSGVLVSLGSTVLTQVLILLQRMIRLCVIKLSHLMNYSTLKPCLLLFLFRVILMMGVLQSTLQTWLRLKPIDGESKLLRILLQKPLIKKMLRLLLKHMIDSRELSVERFFLKLTCSMMKIRQLNLLSLKRVRHVCPVLMTLRKKCIRF